MKATNFTQLDYVYADTRSRVFTPRTILVVRCGAGGHVDSDGFARVFNVLLCLDISHYMSGDLDLYSFIQASIAKHITEGPRDTIGLHFKHSGRKAADEYSDRRILISTSARYATLERYETVIIPE